MAELLAKSGTPQKRGRLLTEHTQDVVDAVEALFGTPEAPSTLAREWCAFFGVAEGLVGSFVAHVRLAAFCHDWGKANDGFQGMLTKKEQQLLRHEQVSAILMCWSSVWTWLEGSRLDVPVILSAVVGHHLKCREDDLGSVEGEPRQILRLRWDEPSFRLWMSSRANAVGVSSEVPFDVPAAAGFDARRGIVDLQAMLVEVGQRLESLELAIRSDGDSSVKRRRMLWAVRAGLITADSAGSGLPRNHKPVGHWIAECLRYRGVGASADGRMTGETIRHQVIRPRMAYAKLAETDLSEFQKACGERTRVSGRTLLMAPCGSGKTLAAWRWIAAQLDHRPRGRAVFLYPTRGTATEGYRDYAGLAGDDLAALVHGTADLDLDGILGDASPEKRITEARLFALRQWPKRFFSATVDQFLGFMQYGYAAMCLLPMLADSVLVLDEIHSYDRGMWSALMEFLRSFPSIPVLCMTATLLRRRIDDLRSAGIDVMDGIDLDAGGESVVAKAAIYRRYQVERIVDRSAAREVAAKALNNGQRVLWVVNTVDECQAIARSFASDPNAEELWTAEGVPIFCYHSRFKLVDRKTWHERVIGSFKRGSLATAVLAVTTQVCEMSLDLDADVLITEACPATALVQRMGRCCRDPKAHRNGRVGEVYIYPPARMLPYAKEDLEGVDRLVKSMAEADAVSQEELAELLEGISPPVELPKACRFTQSGVWAASGEEQFRDTEDIGRPALLAEDVDEYRRLRDSRRRGGEPPWKADELVVSLPKRLTQDTGEHGIPPYLKLAHGGTYRIALGYCGGDVATHKFG